MELIFLGTSAGKPSGKRNVTSLALNLSAQYGGVWLFDCGEATQHQLMRSTLTAHKINKIFITHLHGDHVLGLPGLLTSRAMAENAPPLEVYGPVGIKELITTFLRLTASFITYDLKIIEINTGIILQDAQFTISTLELKHPIQSFGFRIQQAHRPGKLDMQRLAKEGVDAEPWLKKIKNAQTIQLPDGRTIHGADYIGAAITGKTMAIFGDTSPCPNALKLASHADVIVHEATLEAALHERAQQYGHSTTAQAAQLAKDSQAKKLIITHISARYTAEDEQHLLQECRAIFPNTQMAHDLQCFELA